MPLQSNAFGGKGWAWPGTAVRQHPRWRMTNPLRRVSHAVNTTMKTLLIGASASGCGKTTFTLGLLRALARRGLRVQPAKVGPDYLDSGWHRAVSGVDSCNLDGFMLPPATLNGLYNQRSQQADITVIEGVMGLYDGIGSDPLDGSSAGLAHQLDCPVVLLIDGSAVSTSAAATVLGFRQLDPRLKLAGVVLNRVNSDGHYQLLRQAIERYAGVAVLGRLPQMAALTLPSRHLGLVSADTRQGEAARWDTLAQLIEQHVDIPRLLSLSEVTPAQPASLPPLPAELDGEGLTLALAEDEAFHFYYADNLALLTQLGVRIVRFSPLRDRRLPPCQMVYLGGGYPELHAARLAANRPLHDALRDAQRRGVPIYAECGGLMYLGQALTDSAGMRHEMSGVLPGQSRMTSSLQRFGYCTASAQRPTLLTRPGETLRGHEFHYSTFETPLPAAFRLQRTLADGTLSHWQGGYQQGNTLAGYLHLHFWQRPTMLQGWLARAREVQG